MIDTSVIISDVVLDSSMGADIILSAPLSDNASSSFSSDDLNMGYFWAIPSDAFGLQPFAFLVQFDATETGDSIPYNDVFGSTVGGNMDPGGQIGVGLTNTPINTAYWSDANPITVASVVTSVQYWS